MAQHLSMTFPEFKHNDRVSPFLMLSLFSSHYIFIVFWWIRILWQMSKEAKDCFFSFFFILEEKKINFWCRLMEFLNDLHMSPNDMVTHFNLQQNTISSLIFFSWHRALKRLNPPTGKHCINELMYIVLAPCSVEATLYNTSIV